MTLPRGEKRTTSAHLVEDTSVNNVLGTLIELTADEEQVSFASERFEVLQAFKKSSRSKWRRTFAGSTGTVARLRCPYTS